MKMIHPQDRVRYEQLRAQALLADGQFDVEYRIVTPHGTRWMNQRGQTHPGKAGHLDYRAGVVQDITARKISELALAHSLDLLRSTGEMAMVGGWEIAIDGKQFYASEQLRHIYELAPGDPFTLGFAKRAFTRGERRKLTQAVRAAIESGTPWDMELPMVTAKGRCVWVRSQGQALKLDGKVQRLTGAMQDITVQHASRQHLRLLETSISRLNDIVLITEGEPFDEPGPRITFVNKAFERRTSYTQAEVIGKTPRILQGPKTQRAELDRIGKALRAWQPVRGELINYTKSGEEFWLELDIVPIADSKGQVTHWVAVERDITERNKAHEEVVRLNADLEARVARRTTELERKTQDLELLAYLIAHDLRQTLITIGGDVHLLKK